MRITVKLTPLQLDNKIGTIKAIRLLIPRAGLKEVKDIVEAAWFNDVSMNLPAAPITITATFDADHCLRLAFVTATDTFSGDTNRDYILRHLQVEILMVPIQHFTLNN